MTLEEIEERFEICRRCPICDQDNGLCNGQLYLNPKNNDISISPKEGYIKGCGCLLEKKIPNEKKHCPAGKW